MLEATRVDRAEGVVFQSAEVDHNGTLGCVYPRLGIDLLRPGCFPGR